MSSQYGHDKLRWEVVHERLEKARQALETSRNPSARQTRAILRERARALARKPAEHEPGGEQLEVVTFMLANERYALESAVVDEVVPLRQFTPIPFTPPFVLGVISLHSQIVSVLDLREFFGLPRRGLGDLNKVLIVKSEEMVFGVLADSVTGTRVLPRDSLQESVHTITDARESYLMGITPDRLIVLDGSRLLSDRRIVVSDNSYSDRNA
jgi:purine-binding chemotaxis protein CheW